MKIFVGQDDFESMSAKQKIAAKKEAEVKMNTLDSLIPVQLSDEDMAEFVRAFHPKRAAKAPQAFMDEFLFLTEVSAYINSIFTGLRYGLHKFVSANGGLNSEELGQAITREIELTYAATKEQERIAKAFMMNIASGSHHIIRDSLRYKGGKDIIYSGLRGPNISPLLHSEHPTPHSIPVVTTSYTYRNMEASFATEFGKALIETGKQLQGILLGEGQNVAEIKSAYSRISMQHEISAAWNLIARLTKLFASGPLAKIGVPVLLPEFEDTQTEHAVSRLSKYVSVLVLREPNYTVVQQRARNADLPDESLDVCIESAILQPDIRFSIAVNLPKTFCEYITQTKNEQIPLVPLNTWVTVWSMAMLRPPRMRSGAEGRSSGDDARLITPHRAPRYVLRPSASDELLARRKELGLYSEKGRVNDDGLMITYNGDLSFVPTSEDTATANAKAYEALMEEALSISFDAGTPLAAGQRGSTGLIFDVASPNYAGKIQALKDRLSMYKGSVQAINWDLNTVLTVSLTDPDRLVSTKLTGGATPDALNLATYMRLPLGQAMRDMFSRSRVTLPDGKSLHMTSVAFESLMEGIRSSSLFENFGILYNHLLKQQLVPSLQDLVKKAAEALKISSLEDESVMEYELNRVDTAKTIYGTLLGKDLTVSADVIDVGGTLRLLFAIAAHQASAAAGTTLAWYCIKNNVEFSEHDRYYNGKTNTAGELGKVYQWFGAQVFLQAVKAILSLPRKTFVDLAEVPTDPANPNDKYPNFLAISREVLPMCVVYGKYVMPEIRDAIYKQADTIVEDRSKFTEQDLNLAGSRAKSADGKGGMKLFPHQAVALSQLKAHPKIAILDIAPGGGKTTIGVADIACLYADGLIKRPFVFCPPRLVRNWIEDLHKSFKGWNAIPVTTETYAEWGEERLTELIQTAPPNTVIVVGNSFISNTPKQQLVIGNTVDTLSNAVEFCKKFEPDYVIIDESHRIRNTTSAIHQGIKTIMQMSSVKYGRIATGTLIQNVLSDVVGQSAVFNGQIFRTTQEFEATHKGVVAIVNDKQVVDYFKDTPFKARRRLSDFATVISFKRKEWAFMLPMPIETFITVNMDEHGDLGHMLQQFYNAVLKKTLEEAKNDPKLKKLKKGAKDEDEEETSEETHDRTVTNAAGTSVEVSDDDDDSEDTDNLEAALQPYLQRLERLLTDPFGDEDLLPVAKEIFGDAFAEDYVTPKVQKVIDRIRMHFAPNEWQKGKEYAASDIADFNGKTYIYKSDLPAGSGRERSDMSPDSDTTNWKPQIRGKIFIACRYTRSVEAIFRALPKELRDRSVRFHGDVDNKDESLNKFQNDPNTDILIGNEMGISEGHNFQMATRFIRVEAPWAPGELDQTASRIFRPDVGGEYTRQTIFLDWILCDNTLEVAKMGRLISKMLKRAQFDELDNPKYFKGLNPANLPIIKMSLDNIRSLYKVDDLCSFAGEGSIEGVHSHSYIGQYQFLVSEMGREFAEMRTTRRAYMLDVEPTPMPEGSSELEFTPWVPNLKVEDKQNDGLIPLKAALESGDLELAQAFKKDPRAIIGQFVRTEFGLGTITRVTTTKGRSTEEDGDDIGRGISKVQVALAQGGNVEMLSASKVYLATNITERSKSKYNKKAPKITEADKERTAPNRKKAEAAVERIRVRARKSEETAKVAARVVRKQVEKETAEAKREIALYPVIYNEFLALEGMEDDADSKALRRFGFTRFGNYAWLPIKTYQNFTAVLEFLEKSFTLDPKTVRYLDSLHDSFQSGRGRKFAIELAPTAELPQFYRMRHRLTQIKNRKRPELKLYPVIINGSLMLVVDLATNPIFRKYLNKSLKGMTGASKFQEADGMDIHFFTTKSQLISKVRELRKNGFTITNLDELKSEVESLNFKTKSSKR